MCAGDPVPEQARLDGPQPDVGVLADRVVPVRAVLFAGACGLPVLHVGAGLEIVVITFPLWAGGWTAFLTTTLATTPLAWVRPVVMIQAAFGAISVAVLAGFLLRVPLDRPQVATAASPLWWGVVGVVGDFTGVLGSPREPPASAEPGTGRRPGSPAPGRIPSDTWGR